MPIATITDVQSIDHANSKPGRVTFSDGKSITTFDPAVMDAAQNLRGQRVDYADCRVFARAQVSTPLNQGE